MFDKLKQIQKLKELQDQLSRERIEVEKEGVRLVMNGKMEMEEVVLDNQLPKDQQEKLLKDCFNEAVKKIQATAAQKMFQM